MITDSRPPEPAGPCVWRRLPGQADRAVARVDGQNRVRDQRRSPVAAPCRLNDENSPAKFQNVRGDSSAVLPREAIEARHLANWETVEQAKARFQREAARAERSVARQVRSLTRALDRLLR